MRREYPLLAMAAVVSFFIVVNAAFAQTWTLTSAPTNYWTSVAASAPGETAPAWAVGFGKEFWRRPAPGEVALPNPATNGVPASASFNVGEVIERVSHAWIAGPAGSPSQVKARTYAASISGTELRFSPHPFAPAAELPAEAVFRTLSVRRGGRVFYASGSPVGAGSFVGNISQALLALEFGLVQHCEARAEGVAVTWVIARSLPGAGPLVLETELSGLTHTGATPNGHHFADAMGVARVRIGNVTVVDSRGSSWNVMMRAEAGHLRLEVPDAVVAGATYPLAIDPVISAEFGMDSPVLVPGDAGWTVAAGNGSGYFVVWEDYRNSPGSQFSDLYGARVSGAGRVLDPHGIAICTASNDQRFPAIAANGTDYFVVWQDRRNSMFVLDSGFDIYGTRVTSNGVVRDTNGIAISLAADAQLFPAVAARGSDYLVAWEDRRSGSANDIYGTRVTSAGVVTDPAGRAISTAIFDQGAPSVASNGTNWFVVWHDLRNGLDFYDIYGARVTSAGVVSDLNGIPISRLRGGRGQHYPAVASDSVSYFVVWQDDRNNFDFSNRDLYGARVTGAGLVVDSDGIAITTAPGDQFRPGVGFTGTNYLVVWSNLGAGGNATRIAITGAVLDPSGLIVSLEPGGCCGNVAGNGTNFLLVGGGYGGRISGDGVQLDSPFPIRFVPNSQTRPAVAFNGTDYLVVWEDNRNQMNDPFTGIDIYGARLTQAGVVADPNGIAICTAPSDQTLPAVAASGSDFLVVWNEGFNLSAARVTGTGVVADSNGIPLSMAFNGYQVPAGVAGNGSGWLVVWTGQRILPVGSDIFGARLTLGGVVSDSNPIAICTVTNDQYFPAVAASGDDYLVVWQDERRPPPFGFPRDVFAARVSGVGAVLDPGGIRISTSAVANGNPAIAANGHNYFVVWADQRTALPGRGLYGARVSNAGIVADPDGLLLKAESTSAWQFDPSVAAGEDEYLVIMSNPDVSPNRGYGVRVARNGCVWDAASLAVGQFPKVAGSGAGRFLIVSTSFRDGAIRTAGNFVSSDPSPPPMLQSVSKSGGTVTLVWSAETCRTYHVQFKADLGEAAWTDLPGEVIASGAVAAKVDDTFGNAPQRFYRVVSP